MTKLYKQTSTICSLLHENELCSYAKRKLCFVASCPTLLPFACVPGASPSMLAFSPVVLTGPRTNGIPFALSLQWVPFVLPSPQVAPLPMGHTWE
ncbi:unnamed protein product [Nyctereutes procyonoides]|uniref:(raccoon dog) hypothetical protein n=1 Tax=Nyctereutes procyonoides TaxID=34880 RepID=A0A811ZY76_NYCPR|nr:unnamed protein product [Nyctereutes procyonoides]